ncbi:Acyl-ACP thioesterase, partial [Cynara cardunculus var. scolymus]
MPTITTTFRKPLMILDCKKKGLELVSDIGVGSLVKDGHELKGFVKLYHWELEHLFQISYRGDVIQIDTWISAFGKNGMSTNWMLCDCKTGDILMRASSTFVMINKETRRLSKIPLEVRAELEKYFVDTAPIIEEITSNFPKLDKNNVYVRNELTPRWSDLDANQHVNNLKYVGWILQDVPERILENYELASMTLKYCRECTMGSVVHAYTSILGNNNGGIAYYSHVDCQHQLQLDVAGGDGEIILEGRTRWRPKNTTTSFFHKGSKDDDDVDEES